MRGGVGITLLHAFLHLVAGVTAAHRTRDRGDFLTATATDLVAQQTTRHRPQYGTGDLVLIFYRRLPGNSDILADFTWRLDLLFDRLDRQHLSVLRAAFYQLIGGNSPPSSDSDST
ncbi:hypothetical protein D3C71_1887470 [compost metagenome]